jgi:hypothetical protein
MLCVQPVFSADDRTRKREVLSVLRQQNDSVLTTFYLCTHRLPLRAMISGVPVEEGLADELT